MAMCRINHDPIVVGSIVRNEGFGSRLMKVIKIEKDAANGVSTVTLKTYGSTNHGTFKPAKFPRTIKGATLNSLRGFMGVDPNIPDPFFPDVVIVGWDDPLRFGCSNYQHVTPQWTKEQEIC